MATIDDQALRRRPLTTQEMADLVNAILDSEVFDARAIRAEIDTGRIRAFPIGAGRKKRRLRVTVVDFLQWARQVLRDEEVQRLRHSLAEAS